jgi:hypothetical protein
MKGSNTFKMKIFTMKVVTLMRMKSKINSMEEEKMSHLQLIREEEKQRRPQSQKVIRRKTKTEIKHRI